LGILNCELETNTMKALQHACNWTANMKKWVKGITTMPLEYFDVVDESLKNGATHKLVFRKTLLLQKNSMNIQDKKMGKIYPI